MDDVGTDGRQVIVGKVGETATGGVDDVAIVALEATVSEPTRSYASAGTAIGGNNSVVKSIAYGGAAIALSSGDANASGLAYVYRAGTASVSDSGVAYCHTDGKASATNMVACVGLNGDASALSGVALTNHGNASCAEYGIAAVREGGSASSGYAGISVLWNRIHDMPNGNAEPSLGVASTGENGLIVAFTSVDNGKAFPVVGFTSGDEEHNVPWQAHFGLKPNQKYRLNKETGLFVEA